MNIKIKSLKKSLFNACNKLIISNNAKTVTSSFDTDVQSPTFYHEINKKKKRSFNKLSAKNIAQPKKIVRKNNVNSEISRSVSNDSFYTKNDSLFYEEVKCENQVFASASSGYGTTSVKSALSVFVNLDNYFYDENFAKIKDKAQENVQTMKSNIINCLLEYQIEYLSILKNGLEHQIRPLSALIDTKLFLQTFLNIEKIYSFTQFIRNAINESMLLTNDLYSSVVSVTHEYIVILANTYEFYLRGYAQSLASTEKSEFLQALKMVNHNVHDFDLIQFIDLPVKNITKIYCAFMSLLEITPASESDDHERLNAICHKLKQLVGPSSDASLTTNHFNITSGNYNVNQSSSFESTNFLLENAIDNKNNSIQLTPKDLKYDYSKLIQTNKSGSSSSSKKSYRPKKIKTTNNHKLQKKLSNPKILPTDFTDFDGNKYYFI